MTDREITLRANDGLPSWFAIEWAEHDGRSWMERIDLGDGMSCMGFMTSARLGNADLEGTASEMASIADAIETGQSVSFTRCAADALGDGRYALSSPRNSISASEVSAVQAQHLAAEIRRVLREATR